MTTSTSTSSIDFIRTVFGNTELPVHFSSLGNERDGSHAPRQLNSRNPDDVTAFVGKWDQKDRGLFYCVSTLKAGSHKRNKDNVAELPMLFADIDLKDVEESVEEIEFRLNTRLRMPPTILVRSGNGIHAIWMLKEAIDLQSEGAIDRVEAALRQLADIVGGDLQVCEVARLLRLPGTHNTKRGEFKEVTAKPVDMAPPLNPQYEMDDIEEWLGEQSPIILRKERERSVTARQAVELDPYLAYAKENGSKIPIDVPARLDAMMFMGTGDAAIHATQLAVSSSMLNAGASTEEVVEVLLAATQAAAGDYGKRWNWRIEERSIRRMCESWHKKYTPKGSAPSPGPSTDQVEVKRSDNGSPPTGGATVISMAGAAAALKKPKPVPKPDDDDASHVTIGKAVIGVIQSRGDDLIFTEKAAWYCEKGLWRMMTDGAAWLNVEIQQAIVSLNFAQTLKVVNETRGWIQRQPALWRKEIPWDQHGKVPTLSGLVDPRTLEVTPLRPEDYATWRVEEKYDPTAACPWWLQMLADVFEDRQPEVRDQTIAVIQELLGAGLLDKKPREITRALIFQGGSNFGKSGLLEVLGGLFGQEQNSTPIEQLEGTHGMMPFINRRPWVLHEAFDQRKWHFSSSVKAIITGEPVGVNIKNGPMLSIRVRSPIFWGTNHPPQFKEATKAVVNRLAVIECRREFIDGQPVGAAAEAFRQGLDKPSSLVLRDEMAGVLAWALEGLKRALARNALSLTKEMMETNEAIRGDSNLVAGFLDDCVVYDPDRRVSVPDFCLAFGAWWLANKGENRQPPSNESIGKNLLAMADSMIAINPKELRDTTRRYYGGIALNEEGLSFHQAGSELQELRGKTANATDPKGNVNSMIPDSWGTKSSVFAMRKRHEKGMTRAAVIENRELSSVIENNDSSPSDAPTVIDLSSQLSFAKAAAGVGAFGDPKF